MIYASVCAGIEAASVAWEPLGWKPAWFSEIDPHACSVLEHRFPNVENLGDISDIDGRQYRGSVDVLVGGTPCQSFSVAGLRKGLGDDRGNLAFEFLRLAQEIRPRWVVWENVPGVLSALSHAAPDRRPPDIDLDAGDGPRDGEEIVVVDRYESDEDHAFACFLAGLSELGYGWAFRILDAQFGRVQSHPRAVPQRRRRVFVVGHLGTPRREPHGKRRTPDRRRRNADTRPERPAGDWRLPAAVLFEREGLSWHPAPSRKAGKAVASLTASGVGTCGADDIQAQHGHIVTDDSESSGLPVREVRGDELGDMAPDMRVVRSRAGGSAVAPPLTTSPYADNESRENLLVPEVSPAVTSKWHKGTGGPSGDECQNLVPDGYVAEVAPTMTGRKRTDGGEELGGTDFKLDGGLVAHAPEVAPPVTASGPPFSRTGNERTEADALVAHPLRAEGHDASEDGTGRGTPIIAFDPTQVTSKTNRSNPQPGDPCHTLAAGADPPAIVAIQGNASEPIVSESGEAPTLDTKAAQIAVADVMAFDSKDSNPSPSDGVSPTLIADKPGKAGARVAVADVTGTLDRDYGQQGGTTHQAARSGLLVVEEEAIAIQERAASENPEAGPQSKGYNEDGAAYTLEARDRPQIAAYGLNARQDPQSHEEHIGAHDASRPVQAVVGPTMVRRITPREAERLMGFRDNWTLVPHQGKLMADGPRYRLLGNSMATNVMSWIGQRIQMLEKVLR